VDCIKADKEKTCQSELPAANAFLPVNPLDIDVYGIAVATRLQRLLERSGAHCEMKLYPGTGRGFNSYQLLDPGQRTIQFLQRHL
jgi:hypothetical protein